MNNSIYLRRSGKLWFEKGNETRPPEYLAALQKNLSALGYSLEPELAEVMLSLPQDKLSRAWKQLETDLRAIVGAHVDYKPMYPNFPEQVKQTPETELYLNALLHYWGDAIGRRIMPLFEKKPRPALEDIVRLKQIKLGSREDYNQNFIQLLSAKIAISPADKEDLADFVKNRGQSIWPLIPAQIPLRENLALLGALLLRHAHTEAAAIAEFLAERINSPTDVLRLATALSDGDLSLAQNTRFISFSKAQRRILLGRLDRLPEPQFDMQRQREKWKRLGERLHPGGFKNRFANAWAAFEAIRSETPIRTFGSRVEAALKEKNVQTALELLKQRPGELARKLDLLLRSDENARPQVLAAFESLAAQVSSPVLLQLLAHFQQRDQPGPVRVFFPKGNLGRLKAIDNTLPVLPATLCRQVTGICRAALRQRYSVLPPLGKVYLDVGLRNYTVPFALRSASKALRTLARGSRLALPPGDTLRFFIWWKDGASRTDLDLNALGLDAEHRFKMEITYYHLEDLGGCHSGDITSAPEGASEFIDLHLPSCLEAGIRYVMMSVHSFTDQAYCDLPECFAGFMMRQKPDSGEIYDPRTVAERFDLGAESTIAIPLIFDLTAREMLWTDLSLKRNPETNNNVHNNLSSLSLLSMAMQNLVRPRLYDLFELHAEARGQRVYEAGQADVVFSPDRGITPFDTARIISEFI